MRELQAVRVNGNFEIGLNLYSVNKVFHPDYFLNKYKLHWNTGNGYRDDYCLNAKGNVDFVSGYFDINFYIGSGSPQNASSLPASTASSLVGQVLGRVISTDGSQGANVGNVSLERRFTEYDKKVSVNDPNIGEISIGSGYKKSDSVVVDNSLSTMLRPSGHKYSTPAVSTRGLNGGEFIGLYENGVKIENSVWASKVDTDCVAVFGVKRTITLLPNGGSGAMDPLPCYSSVSDYIDQGSIPACSFSNEGFIFVGWNTDPSGKGRRYDDEADVSAIADAEGSVTLYAQWRRPTVYVTNSHPEYGTLSLYRNQIGTNPVATEANGVLAADAADGHYIVLCEPKTKLHYGSGIGRSAASIVYPAQFNAANRNVTEFDLKVSEEGQIEAKFWYAKRPTYRIDFSFSPAGSGSAVIQKLTDGRYPEGTDASKPDETIGGVAYWLPQPLRFIVRPSDGYEGIALRVKVGESYPFETVDPEEYPTPTYFDLTGLGGDALVQVEMRKTRHKMSVSVDGPSQPFGTASVSAEESEYGSAVTFSASLKDGIDASRYVFDGWYGEDGKVSSDAEYVIESITGNVSLVAKFSARVTMRIAFDDNRDDKTLPITENGTLVVNGLLGEGNRFDEFVTLGDTVSYVVTPGITAPGGVRWSFNAWYGLSDVSYENPLAYPMSGEISVSESVGIVARLVSQRIMSKLLVRVFVNSEYGSGEFVDADAGNPHVTSELPVSEDIEEERETVEGGAYAFYIYGSREVRLDVVRPSIVVGDREVAFNYFATSTDNTEASVISRSTSYSRLLNRKPSANETIYLIYGNPGKVTTRITYANGDSTSGTLSIGDETNDGSGAYVVSKTEDQGKTLTISAKAKNGWRFVGWYEGSASGSHFSTRTPETITVTSERTILADFQKDSSAVYAWEGSAENKTAVWKSRMYASGRPFNPAGIRVDVTDERGVGRVVGEVTVEMMSSPDVKPRKESIVEMTNMSVDVARRLPMRRPERYLQVEVRNDREVDRIVIGTSMMELAQ